MNDFGKLNFSVAFQPTSAFPLDARYYFDSKAAADAAAAAAVEVGSTDGSHFFGETVVVNEGGDVKLYLITPAHTLKELASAQSTGDVAGDLASLSAKYEAFRTEYATLSGRVDANEDLLKTLSADEDTAGSIANLQKQVTEEVAARGAHDSFLSGKIDVINGTGEGSIAKALADANSHANDISSSLSSTAHDEIAAVESNLTSNYVTKTVVEGVATTDDKLQKRSDVTSYVAAEIQKLDVAELTMLAGESISSIQEVDGKIIVGKQAIQISKSQVTDLTSDLATVDAKLAYLGEVSADHETRISAAESDIDDLQADVADHASTINAVSSDYVKASDFNTLSVEIGLNEATSTNKVVTAKDIRDLEGAMHFVGVATRKGEETDAEALAREFPKPKKGDVAVISDNGKEYIQVTDMTEEGAVAVWREIGDEGLYATKAELETKVNELTTAIDTAKTAALNHADSISSSLSTTVAAALTAEAQAREDAVTALTSSINSLSATVKADFALSADVTTIHNELTAADAANKTELEGKISAEKTRAEGVEAYISGKVDNKVLVDGLSADQLKVVHINQADWHQKVVDGTLLSNEIYVVSGDYVDTFGQQIKNVAAPTESGDATNKEYVDNAITAANKAATDGIAAVQTQVTELSTYTHALSASQLIWDIEEIHCGNAS